MKEVQNQRVICVITGSGFSPEDPSLYCVTLEATNLDVLFNLHNFIALIDYTFSKRMLERS